MLWRRRRRHVTVASVAVASMVVASMAVALVL
jgi:hypothetical protein